MIAALAFLSRIPRGVWIALAAAAIVAGFFLWINGLHRQIARAQAEARAAHVQTAHAVLYGVNRQAQVFADVASIVSLRRGVEAQNASLAAAEATARQMAAAQAQAARQTAQALQTRDRTIAALRARRLTPDDCEQARELLRGN